MRLGVSVLAASLCVAVSLPSLAAGLNSSQGPWEHENIESLVPRDGLHFYFEVSGSALPQLAQAADGLKTFFAALLSEPGARGPSDQELARFALSNSGALMGSRLALVNHRATGPMLFIASPSAAAADQLGGDLARLFGSASIKVSTQSRFVVAGKQDALSRLAEMSGEVTLAEDSQFSKARERFASEPLFGYIEPGSGAMPWPDGLQGSAYTAGMMAALSSMPYAIAMGGSLDGDSVRINALLIQGSKAKQGLFASLFSSSQAGRASAAEHVSPNLDFFIDIMVDWDKLYDDISALVGMFAAAAPDNAPRQGTGDLLATIESSLGFSIKYDLLPTLGNELAIGFDTRTLAPAARSAPAARTKAPSVVLLVAVRDRVGLEKLIEKLLSAGRGPNAASQFSRTPYRGTTINSASSVAYAIHDGFLILAGSVAEVRRHIDAHASGTSLSSTREFRSAVGSPGEISAQFYISARALGSLVRALPPGVKFPGLASPGRTDSSIGVVMTPDPEGQLLAIRVPKKLGIMALASAMKTAPAPYGISSGTGGRRKSPTLTTEDLVRRRP